jgi:hypothetical protein
MKVGFGTGVDIGPDSHGENRRKALAFVEVREGKPRVRWGPYFLGLTIVVAATGLLNGLLMAAGLWSGVDTVLFGLFACVVLFNILVIYQFNLASKSAPPTLPAASSSAPSGLPPSGSHAQAGSRSGYCPRCGAALAPDTAKGLCPRCLMAPNVALPTDVPMGASGPGGTQAVKTPPGAPLPLAEVARHFPQLEILECFGCGGMGAVYKARQPRLDRRRHL